MAVTDLQAGLMTADDLLRLYGEGVRGELIRGVLCQTTPTGNEHGVIVVNVASELRNFIKPGKLGRVTASDSGVWLEHDPDTVREPDIAYFSAQKIPLDERVTGYAEVVPDLVVEVASPRRHPPPGQRQGPHVAQLRRTLGMGRAPRHPHRRCPSSPFRRINAHPERHA